VAAQRLPTSCVGSAKPRDTVRRTLARGVIHGDAEELNAVCEALILDVRVPMKVVIFTVWSTEGSVRWLAI
jgi:hypothetical protein